MMKLGSSSCRSCSSSSRPSTTSSRARASPASPPRLHRRPVATTAASPSDDAGADAAPSTTTTPAAATPQQQQQDKHQQQQQPSAPRRRRQADSTDAVASFLTRRFGIAGGLAWLGVLTFGVVSEQVKTRRELQEEQAGTRDVAASVEKPIAGGGGAVYRELRVGGGARPQKGDLVVLEFDARASSDGGVTFADQPFVDTRKRKPVVLVWGARPLPLAAGVCEAVVAAIAADGMRAGGRRVVTVPADSPAGFGASPPAGSGVGAGAALRYDLTLSRVSVAPS